VSLQDKSLICFALEEEAKALRQRIWTERGTILITGIGRQNAEASVREFLVLKSPERVFTCGFAGGLNPELEHGAVVFTTDNTQLREKLLGAGAKLATFFCATQIATTAGEKAELRRTTGADVVEMESEAIHALCRERGIPCATVRVVSDTANEDLPLDFNRLSNPDSSLNYGKLALAVAKSPGKIPALLRLQKHSRLAAERLAQVLGKIL
jgi:adenosylhomocysteine nucleosidase